MSLKTRLVRKEAAEIKKKITSYIVGSYLLFLWTYKKVSSGTWKRNGGDEFATFESVSAKYVQGEVANGKNGYVSAADVDIWGYYI